MRHRSRARVALVPQLHPHAPSLENLHIRHLSSRREVLSQPVILQVLRYVLDTESRRGRRRLLILAVEWEGFHSVGTILLCHFPRARAACLSHSFRSGVWEKGRERLWRVVPFFLFRFSSPERGKKFERLRCCGAAWAVSGSVGGPKFATLFSRAPAPMNRGQNHHS